MRVGENNMARVGDGWTKLRRQRFLSCWAWASRVSTKLSFFVSCEVMP